MGIGVLLQGFSINNGDRIHKNLTITLGLRYGASIPKDTIVFMGRTKVGDDVVPCVKFRNFQGIRLLKFGSSWFADIYGLLVKINYDTQNPPYPLSYFK